MVRTIDGVKTPIGPDKPKKITLGVVTLAVGLGVSLAVTTPGATGAGAPAVSASQNASVSLREARTTNQKSDRTRARLSTQHPDIRANGETSTSNCASAAVGEVRDYLLQHPCVVLQRADFTVGRYRVGQAAVATAWVEMRSVPEAAALEDILDRPGSGSIQPLDRSVRLTGRHYRSSIDGSLVVTAEAVPLSTIPDPVLDQLARDGAS